MFSRYRSIENGQSYCANLADTHSVSNVAIAARVSFDRVELLNLMSSCDIIAYPVEAASARQ